MYTYADVGETPGTPPKTKAEKEKIAAAWNAEIAAQPLRDWYDQMAESDQIIMPRWAEDFADVLEGLGATLPSETADRLAAKKALRASKPV